MTTTTTALQAPMFRGDNKLEVVTLAALVGFLAASQRR